VNERVIQKRSSEPSSAASRQSRAAPDEGVIEACFFDNFFIFRGSLCLSFLGNFGFFM